MRVQHSEQVQALPHGRPAGEIRDLSDFCQQWDGLRKLIEAHSLEQSSLSPEQQDVVNWLRELADRVCKFEKFSPASDN